MAAINTKTDDEDEKSTDKSNTSKKDSDADGSKKTSSEKSDSDDDKESSSTKTDSSKNLHKIFTDYCYIFICEFENVFVIGEEVRFVVLRSMKC